MQAYTEDTTAKKNEIEICLLNVGPEIEDAKGTILNVGKGIYDYLNLKGFSYEVRYGKTDEVLSLQAKKVKAANEHILNLISKAKEQNLLVYASITMNIRVEDKFNVIKQ